MSVENSTMTTIHSLRQLWKFVIEGDKEWVDILDGFGARNYPIAEKVVKVSLKVGGEVITEQDDWPCWIAPAFEWGETIEG